MEYELCSGCGYGFREYTINQCAIEHYSFDIWYQLLKMQRSLTYRVLNTFHKMNRRVCLQAQMVEMLTKGTGFMWLEGGLVVGKN